ncbi:MAG: DMT family transporter [Chloroflexi bacterium]|nr:DMT family transporter [Chloroflexota bacterium]
MSLSSLAMVLVSVAVGGGIALQSAINAALAKRLGTMEATLVSVTVTWVFVLALLAAGLRSGKLAQVTSAPPHLFLGGFLGAAVLITAIIVVPRLGTAGLIASFVVGQLIGAMLLDYLGAFGLRHIPITPVRVGGAVLLLLGMRMMLR